MPILSQAASADALDHALAPIVASLDAVLSEPAALSGRGADAALYRVAIRRQGRALGEIGGRAAMCRAMRHAAEMVPERSARREAVMDAAWAGLPGW